MIYELFSSSTTTFSNHPTNKQTIAIFIHNDLYEWKNWTRVPNKKLNIQKEKFKMWNRFDEMWEWIEFGSSLLLIFSNDDA